MGSLLIDRWSYNWEVYMPQSVFLLWRSAFHIYFTVMDIPPLSRSVEGSSVAGCLYPWSRDHGFKSRLGNLFVKVGSSYAHSLGFSALLRAELVPNMVASVYSTILISQESETNLSRVEKNHEIMMLNLAAFVISFL